MEDLVTGTVADQGLKGSIEDETGLVSRLKRKKPSRGDVWHLDEVLVSVAGKKHWL